MEKPKIRFKGYQEDWEQRKLGDVLERRIEQRQQSEEYPRLAFASGQGVIPLSERKTNNREQLTKDEYTKKYLVTELNDIVYNPANVKYGAIDRNKCGRGLISPIYVTFTTNEIPGFIERIVTSHDFQQRALRFEEGTVTKRQSVNPEDLVTLDILVAPKREEQQKIATYFDNIDHLITLHQRKCEETKILKKYMLQKMFPQNGNSVPEIRFSGFTEDWEQRKLGDVFEQTSNLVNPKEDEIELWSLTVEDGLTKKSDRYNREFLVKKDDNFKEVRPGDIVYNPMNMTLGAVGYNGMAKSVAVSGYYTTMVAKENYDTYYINTWLKSPQAIRLYRTYATGSLIEKQRVQFPTLSIIPVAFPKYKEQTKIGSYFHSLDNLITLHQRKCEELQNIKKYMLQNMFV